MAGGTHILKLISPAVTALFPIFVWEVWLRPIRERRNAAHVIYLELESNLKSLVTLKKLEAQMTELLLPYLTVSTQGFESLGEKVGALPPDLVLWIIRVYKMIDRFNMMAAAHDRSFEQLVETSQGTHEERQLKKILRDRVSLIYDQVDDLLEAIDKILPALNKQAYPWWSFTKRLPTSSQYLIQSSQQGS